MMKMKAFFTISQGFRDYMKAKKWLQKDVAEMTRKSPDHVSKILNGECEPSMNFLHRLSSATGLGIEDIVVTKFQDARAKK